MVPGGLDLRCVPEPRAESGPDRGRTHPRGAAVQHVPAGPMGLHDGCGYVPVSFQYFCTHVFLVLVLLNTQLAVGVWAAWVRLKIKFSLETFIFGKHRRQGQVVKLPGTMRDALHLLVVLVNAKNVFIFIF